MKPRILAVIVALVLVLSGLLLAGCGEETTTTTQAATVTTQAVTTTSQAPVTTQATTATTAPPASVDPLADQQPLSLKLNYFAPETIPPGIVTAAAAVELEEKTGGKIKVENFFAGTLVGYGDQFAAVSEGTVDIALVSPGEIPLVTTLNKVFGMPLLVMPLDDYLSLDSNREAIETLAALNDELAQLNVRWLMPMPLPAYNYHGVDKAVRVPDDIKGMKVEAAGDGVALLNELGAAPVTIAPGDMYMSLERGLIKAQMTHWAFLNGFKTGELTKHHTLFGDGEGGLYQPTMGYIINLDTWNKLTPEAQRIIQEVYYNASKETIVLNEPLIAAQKKFAADRGDTIIQLTNEEREPWAAFMNPVIDKWVQETEAKGLPGRAVYDSLMEIYTKNNAAKQ